ncbi:primosomal protein N' [Sodalis sp. CWE]|uniref:primosomal protein N' n=1 Tax=Sodalis sp. CWE TaxID=2803816 RepID=UPI001C7D4C71|nr:primosomal protein N' [Sodalis sp. CWE]MBX4180680.1 primosomal protein N' [Sodalis sp. CWE]
MLIVKVVLPVPVAKTFDYLMPNNMSPIIGSRVRVPFGSRQVTGIIISFQDERSKISRDKLKFICKVLDKQSLFSVNLWHVLNWSAKYYHYPTGQVLFHALPALLRHGKPAVINYPRQWIVTEQGRSIKLCSLNRAPQQRRVLALLLKKPIYYHQMNALQLNPSTFYLLRNKGLCILQSKESNMYYDWRLRFQANERKLKLNIEQKTVVKTILSERNKFVVWLLTGASGSGKTDVCLTIIENLLSKGEPALVLVPEINLSLKKIIQFRKYFNVPIEVLHSKLNDSEKLAIWLKVFHGACAIVIGTRSAIFAPFIRLGIIVINEEHDNSYKERKGWRYHARDMAVFRAREEKIPIVLVTSTPSFETIANVYKKKYRQLTLRNRITQLKIVRRKLLNIKGHRLINGLSLPLLSRMRLHLAEGNQVMLYLNRRGFSPVLLCCECGWIATCQRCDRYYTLHQHYHWQLRCHHCRSHCALPYQCLHCGSIGLVTVGVGTEQLEEALISLFPGTPIIRIDRDTIACKNSFRMRLIQAQKGNSCILIGTKILVKNYYFPCITLISFLDIDGVLFSYDFRAPERFAQVYTQIIECSGRTRKQKEVLIQTCYPDHPLLQTLLSYGYMNFAKQSLEERRQTNLPPFSKQILFRAYDQNNHYAQLFLNQLRQILEFSSLHNDDLWIIGPIPAIVPKKDRRFCWQLLLFHLSCYQLQNLITTSLPLINSLPLNKKIRWYLDVDPIEN